MSILWMDMSWDRFLNQDQKAETDYRVGSFVGGQIRPNQ